MLATHGLRISDTTACVSGLVTSDVDLDRTSCTSSGRPIQAAAAPVHTMAPT
jgi:hypothetical protein